MINILESTLDDLDAFSNGSDISHEHIEASILNNVENSMFRKTFTVWDTERKIIICFLGMNYITNGVYEIWMAKSVWIHKYTASLWKKIRMFFKFVLEETPVHRLHVTIESSNFKYIKFLHFMGFHCEGLLKNYRNDGRDFFLLAGGL